MLANPNHKKYVVFFVGLFTGIIISTLFFSISNMPKAKLNQMINAEPMSARIGDPKATKSSENLIQTSEIKPLLWNCEKDRILYCKDMTIDQPGLVGCLVDRAADLLPECKLVLHNQLQLRSQCKNEIQKFCTDVPSGQGRVQKCLEAQAKKLSIGCSQILSKLDKTNS